MFSHMPYRIRPMAEDDIKNVLRIQAAVYPPNILESAAFFENRLSLSADNCWVAANGAEPSGSLLGYLISYPWQRAFPPELDGTLDALPKFADSWFVHDCAIAPNAQRLGVGRRCLTPLAAARSGRALATPAWCLWRRPKAIGKVRGIGPWPKRRGCGKS